MRPFAVTIGWRLSPLSGQGSVYHRGQYRTETSVEGPTRQWKGVEAVRRR